MRKYLWMILLILGLTALCASQSFASEEEDDGWWEPPTENPEKPDKPDPKRIKTIDDIRRELGLPPEGYKPPVKHVPGYGDGGGGGGGWTLPVLPPIKPILLPRSWINPLPGGERIICMALGCERLPIGYFPLPGPETISQDNAFVPVPIYPPVTNPLPVLGEGSGGIGGAGNAGGSGGTAGDTGTTGGTPGAAGATDGVGAAGEAGTTGVSATAPIVPLSVWIIVPSEGGLNVTGGGTNVNDTTGTIATGKGIPINTVNIIPQVSKTDEASAYFALNTNAKITLQGNIKAQGISGMRGFRLSLPSCITSF